MSFLNQLKSQASALQSKQSQTQLNLEENTAQTEDACRFALQYLHDLAKHLNVIAPKAPRFSLADLQRVDARLAMGPVKHERKEVRHPEKNTLLALQFEYITETRGNVVVTPDHNKAQFAFRLLNANGFEILNTTWPAARVRAELLDELAKLIVSEPNRFV